MIDERKTPSVERTTEVRFVARLTDAYTGRPISKCESVSRAVTRRQWQSEWRGRNVARHPRISLKEVTSDEARDFIRDVDPNLVVTNTGFLLFLDVELSTNASIGIDIDGGQHYLNESDLAVDQTALNRVDESNSGRPTDLVARIDARRSLTPQKIQLRPSPGYRFPAGATLLRGQVRDRDGKGVEGATLTVVGRAQTTQTTDNGEFVLYFKPPGYEVRKENGTKTIKIDGRTPRIRVEYDPPSADTDPLIAEASLAAEEGRTRSYLLSYEETGDLRVDETTSN